ncbi:hypothetical protein [Nocardia sp. NPDC019302]|uniref:hypothetical protein n=1 Tax=Nocardia sp. NPDC019302 TaxID=3154592 RepID=UPI00340E5F0C
MRDYWYGRIEAVQRRTGFRMSATAHKRGCLCSHCHAEMFERAEALDASEEFDDTAAWDRGHDQWIDEQTGVW